MAERIDHLAVAVAPECVFQRHLDGGAGIDRPLPHGVGVFHVQVDRHRRALQRTWAAAAVLGKGVGQHEHRVADAQLGVHDLAAGAVHAPDYLGAEGAPVERQRLGRVVAHQVRGNAVESFGNSAG